jgi:L-ascorbate metabolism protein UlaG (beta-lactamase superfamily)
MREETVGIVWTALCSLVVGGLVGPGSSRAAEPDGIATMFARSLEPKSVACCFLGYSGVILRMPSGTLLIDPGDHLSGEELRALRQARVTAVLYTHGHFDHFHAGTAARLVAQTGATLVVERSLLPALRDVPANRIVVAQPWTRLTVGGFSILPVPGEHIGPIMLYQVKDGGVSLFHAGDSAPVSLVACRSDLALLPVGSPSPTCSPEGALRMARDLRPRVILTMHGTADEAKEFRQSVHGTPAEARGKAAEGEPPRLSARVEIPREHRVQWLDLR